MNPPTLEDLNVALLSVLQKHERYITAKVEGNDDRIRGTKQDLDNSVAQFNQLACPERKSA